MADLTGVFPRMDCGLHSSSSRIEFDFSAPDTGAADDVSLNDWPVFNVDRSADGTSALHAEHYTDGRSRHSGPQWGWEGGGGH